jgi:hypothetical protein
VQAKNTQLNTIWEGLCDVDRWIAKNPDVMVEIPRPSRIERIIVYASLVCFQQARKRVDEETTRSQEICAQLQKVAQVLTYKCHLPPLEELKKTLMMEQILNKIQ